MTSSFWLYNPTILFKSGKMSNIFPTDTMSFDNKLNALTRLVLLLTLFGYIFSRNRKILLYGLASLIIIILLFYIKNGNKKREGGLFKRALFRQSVKQRQQQKQQQQREKQQEQQQQGGFDSGVRNSFKF